MRVVALLKSTPDAEVKQACLKLVQNLAFKETDAEGNVRKQIVDLGVLDILKDMVESETNLDL